MLAVFITVVGFGLLAWWMTRVDTKGSSQVPDHMRDQFKTMKAPDSNSPNAVGDLAAAQKTLRETPVPDPKLPNAVGDLAEVQAVLKKVPTKVATTVAKKPVTKSTSKTV